MSKIYKHTHNNLYAVELEKSKVVVAISDNTIVRDGVFISLPKKTFWPIFEKDMWDDSDPYLQFYLSPDEVRDLIAGLQLVKEQYDTNQFR